MELITLLDPQRGWKGPIDSGLCMDGQAGNAVLFVLKWLLCLTMVGSTVEENIFISFVTNNVILFLQIS